MPTLNYYDACRHRTVLATHDLVTMKPWPLASVIAKAWRFVQIALLAVVSLISYNLDSHLGPSQVDGTITLTRPISHRAEQQLDYVFKNAVLCCTLSLLFSLETWSLDNLFLLTRPRVLLDYVKIVTSIIICNRERKFQ